MEVTLRELQQIERNVARLEAQSAAAESAAGNYGKRLAALREKLDDLVLQVGLVQAELAESGVAAAQAEIQELWIIMYSVDRRFKDLLA